MIIVLTTVAKKSNGESLAKLLIKNKLAACINIIKIENSIYKWKDKLVNSKEYLLVIKSTRPFKQIEKFIKKNHPYELAELMSFKVDGASKEYLKWMTE
ncbi:divalent-cation tolerance protein CutA [Candidatus Micrarchaeota archaeon]|nr:divalent-cation tolerance protein CutA [Candidatus Micrarchaeota archaeon]